MRIAVLLAIFIFVSCSESAAPVPKEVIPRESYKRLLTEMAMAESAANMNLKGYTGSKYDSAYAFDPVAENGFTRAQYDSTLAYYSKNPKLLKELYDEVLTELSDLKLKRPAELKDSTVK